MAHALSPQPPWDSAWVESEAPSVALAGWEDGTGQRRGQKWTPEPVLLAEGINPFFLPETAEFEAG